MSQEINKFVVECVALKKSYETGLDEFVLQGLDLRLNQVHQSL